MDWINTSSEFLAQQIPCGYERDSQPQTEPTAVAALALLALDQSANPRRFTTPIQSARAWLAQTQNTDGSLGPNRDHAIPGWPTTWALIVEAAATELPPAPSSLDVGQGLDWLLGTKGMTMPRSQGGHAELSVLHDVELVGWPWVTGTHTWLEPTCLAILALKAHGLGRHPRVREGVTVLFDRILPAGGCNYGNTVVLGQELRAHVQPTGLLLLALAHEADWPLGPSAMGSFLCPGYRCDGGEIKLPAPVADSAAAYKRQTQLKKSLAWLLSELGTDSTAASLSYGLLGLAAQGIRPRYAVDWLEKSAQRVWQGDRSPYRLALLLYAAARLRQLPVTIPPTAESPANHAAKSNPPERAARGLAIVNWHAGKLATVGGAP
ncbi:MAG: hypothetical protein SFX18_08575 [Pirellulales bacterium]|nr:hypothetical protein [Pirellulales bacterium]